jgi:hypothetical protein
MADDAGALLVRTGLITDQALLAARQSRAQAGGTIGEHLVLSGIVADEALTEFYRSRLLVPRVNPNSLARLPSNVVEAIPVDMAIEFRCVPVALDREGNLTCAMSDPSDSHAVDEIGFFTSKYVVRAVATQMQIAWCLAHYYGHITELGRRLLKPSAAGGAAVAPATPGPDAAAPASPMPRVRGFTGRVEASRHKVIAPVSGEAPAEAPRPTDKILTPTADDLAKVEAAQAAPPAPYDDRPGPDSGPAPVATAPETSEPYAVVEVAPAASAPTQTHVSLLHGDERTPPRGLAQPARRHVEPDPPELAARTGEVDVQERSMRAVDDGPAVVVAFDDEAEPEAVTPEDTPVVSILSQDDTGRQVAAEQVRPISDSDAEEEAEPAAEPEPDDDAEWEAAAWAAAKESAERAATQRDPDESDEPAVIHDVASTEESAPILLVQKRPLKETQPETDEDDPVVLLDRKKPSDPPPPGEGAVPAASIADAIGGAVKAAQRRREKRTVVGVGVPAVPPRAKAPSVPSPSPTTTTTTTTTPDEHQVAVAEVAGTRPWSASTPADGVPTVMEEKESDASTRPHALPPQVDVDDGWGPPGTTIPPPFLGALPGTEQSGKTETIPLSEDSDEQPLLVGGPPPEPLPVLAVAPVDPHAQVRALEQASTTLVELLRELDRASSRDQVIDALLAYLALSHERVAFLALKNAALSPFHQRPPSSRPVPTLSLEQPSTLQDVVGTRLPYRGALVDEASQRFVTEAFGVAPGEVLILPIAVRDRVVAVLYGEGRRGLGFDEHFAIAGRAAGLALERILQAKRASTQP